MLGSPTRPALYSPLAPCACSACKAHRRCTRTFLELQEMPGSTRAQIGTACRRWAWRWKRVQRPNLRLPVVDGPPVILPLLLPLALLPAARSKSRKSAPAHHSHSRKPAGFTLATSSRITAGRLAFATRPLEHHHARHTRNPPRRPSAPSRSHAALRRRAPPSLHRPHHQCKCGSKRGGRRWTPGVTRDTPATPGRGPPAAAAHARWGCSSRDRL